MILPLHYLSYYALNQTSQFNRRYNDCLLNKPEATKYSDYHKISITAHEAKIVAMVLGRRTEKKIDEVLEEHYLGFKQGMGHAIAMLRIISE